VVVLVRERNRGGHPASTDSSSIHSRTSTTTRAITLLSPLPRPTKDHPVIVGVPSEVKRDEYRVGMLPVGVEELTRAGHKGIVQAGTGVGSGFSGAGYHKAAGSTP